MSIPEPTQCRCPECALQDSCAGESCAPNAVLIDALDSLNSFVYLFDRRRWTIEFLNKRWATDLGVPVHDLVGRPISELIDFAHPDAVFYKRFIADGAQVVNDRWLIRLPVITPSGTVTVQASQTVIDGHLFGSAIQSGSFDAVMSRIDALAKRSEAILQKRKDWDGRHQRGVAHC